MSIARTPHEWSKEAFFAKAQRYVEEMLSNDPSEWQFGFWSALALEMMVKAALASISPTLIADGKEWNNVLFAAGRQPNQKKFSPKSADLTVLLANLESAFPEFTKEMLDFSVAHANKRNSEIHSGALPFDDLGTSSWLPRFYLVCEFLLAQMGETLDSLLDSETAEEAREHIKAYKDEAAKVVKQNINAHKTIWDELEPDEKTEKEGQAKNAAMRYWGHRVKCPSCGCIALLHGSPAGVPKKEVGDDEIVEKQRMLPASLECVACGLKVMGYSKLIACGLGDAFVSESSYSPIEYFDISMPDEHENMMDEDFNEPF